MKIDFEFQTEFGMFRDALYLEDGHAFTEEEIEAMKQVRMEHWVTFVSTPPAEVPVDPEEGE
jgi:hypothetical protein